MLPCANERHPAGFPGLLTLEHTVPFSQLGLAPALLEAIHAAGYTQPTAVQTEAIPRALAGKDLMVSSQTGSGKTAAFMLPCLHRLLESGPSRKPTVLVLTPTRELAQQVSQSVQLFSPRQRYAVLVGGAPYGPQLRQLNAGPAIIVATPGRLMDHIERGKIDLRHIETLILDEADRMLDMGFIDDIKYIAERTPANRQTLLFSATLDGVVGDLARRLTRDAEQIGIARTPEAAPRIEQTLLYADDHGHKLRLLDHLLADVSVTQAIIFTGTKSGAESLADRLLGIGHSAEPLHGDMNQSARERAMRRVREGRTRILVATDVAARGLDVPALSHVFNFDLPMQAEDYVHRIGRTGRAGREGFAFTLAQFGERGKIRGIERYTGSALPVSTLPGLEPRPRAERSERSEGDRFNSRRGGPKSSGWAPSRSGRPGGFKPGFSSEHPPSASAPTGKRSENWGRKTAKTPGQGWATGRDPSHTRSDLHGDFRHHEPRKPGGAKSGGASVGGWSTGGRSNKR